MTNLEIAKKIFYTPSHPANQYLAEKYNRRDFEGYLSTSFVQSEVIEMVNSSPEIPQMFFPDFEVSVQIYR